MTNDDIFKKIESYQNTICFLSEQIRQLQLKVDYSQILIEDLQISVWTESRLHNTGIYNVQQLLEFSKADLFKIKGFLKRNYNDLKNELERLNIKWVHEF